MADGISSFWGPVTSSHEWCEKNYVYSSYVAEFYNTISNVPCILLAFIGLVSSLLQRFEKRFSVLHLSNMALGIGSVMYHATLQHVQQQSDETPMVWEMLLDIYILYSPDWHYRSTMPTFLFLYYTSREIHSELRYMHANTTFTICIKETSHRDLNHPFKFHSNNMGFVEKIDMDKCEADSEVEDSKEVVSINRNMSECSLCVTEDDDEEDVQGKIQIGPRRTLKEQYEADKDDESLMRWKEQLLGAVDINSVAETLDPEVKILSLAIVSPGREDLLLRIPDNGKVKGIWFTLKEGSRYSIKFTFQVHNNIVSGLKYTNTVWKTGLKVDKTKEMIGTFSPQQELYTHVIPEDTTPSGILARGSYSAKTKFLDDDNKCYLELNYTFDIRKDWQ